MQSWLSSIPHRLSSRCRLLLCWGRHSRTRVSHRLCLLSHRSWARFRTLGTPRMFLQRWQFHLGHKFGVGRLCCYPLEHSSNQGISRRNHLSKVFLLGLGTHQLGRTYCWLYHIGSSPHIFCRYRQPWPMVCCLGMLLQCNLLRWGFRRSKQLVFGSHHKWHTFRLASSSLFVRSWSLSYICNQHIRILELLGIQNLGHIGF